MEYRLNIDISVIVATYDRPDALARCLGSLVAQKTARTFEIIAVDNHPQSGINTPVMSQFPGVRWLAEKTPGLSRARNCGIAASMGAVIVTTDDDVIAPPEWMERLTFPLFANGGDLAATTGNCLPWKLATEAEVLFEAYGGLRHGDAPREFNCRWMRQWRVCMPQHWRIGTTANAAFRADLFLDRSVGLFETRLGTGTPAGAWEDLYMFHRILTAGYRIRYVPEAWVFHAHRETMPELRRQLCGYRRGETAFLMLLLTRDREFRALGQTLLWIPWWRATLAIRELTRRLKGGRRFSFRLFWAESIAYFGGPWALLRASRDSKLSNKRARDANPVNEKG